jgi:hypothetical protein
MPGFALQFSPTKADVGAGGDIGYTTGTYGMTMNDAAGTPMTENGKYVAVWKKQPDGQWKVVEDIFNTDTGQGPPPAEHVLMTAGSIAWGDAPPSLPPGGKMAVLSGDPTKAGPFTIRAQVPAGYRVPPHWHPTAEHVTVLSGTVGFGMGDKFDPAGLKDITAGGYAVMPAEMRHFVQAKSAATIQVSGMGPFAVVYVNPADDPRQQKQ